MENTFGRDTRISSKCSISSKAIPPSLPFPSWKRRSLLTRMVSDPYINSILRILLDYIIRLTPTARLIPSLWNSEIFLRMVLPDEDKSLTSTLQGKVVTSLSNSGVALAHDLVISKVYFGSNSVETDIKTELPPLTPVSRL